MINNLRNYGMRILILILCISFAGSVYAKDYREQFSGFINQDRTDIHLVSKSNDFENLYFVMEKINQNNLEFWKKYMYTYEIYALALEDYIDDHLSLRDSNEKIAFYYSLSAGLYGMKLQFEAMGAKNTEFWVAYATKDYQQANKVKKMQDIEMAMTVTTSGDAFPLVVHMGIGRFPFHVLYSRFIKQMSEQTGGNRDEIIKSILSYVEGAREYFLSEGMEIFHNNQIDQSFFQDFRQQLIMHPNLSMYLHSFAAKITKTIYRGKNWMTTAPVKIMAEIMKKAVGEDKVITGETDDIRSGRNYPWLSTGSMTPSDLSSYVSIDLEALADLKVMQPIL
jgi:hypothetical protein